MSKLTKRITAMLLSGMLAIGSATGSVYAAAADVDPGLTSEIAEEVFTEEPVETAEAQAESAQTSETVEKVFSEESDETSEAPVDPGQISEEAPLEEAVTSYTVTLDANGGYFDKEWDDSIGDYVEQAGVVVKQIPVGGTVTAVPMYADQDGQSMVFTGWSLERDGELISTGIEEYAPLENCVLYAMWNAVETDSKPGEAVWEEVEENKSESNEPIETAQEPEVIEEEEDAVVGEEILIQEDSAIDSFDSPEADDEQTLELDQDEVYADEVVEGNKEDSSGDAVLEEKTELELIESQEGEETVREDAARGVVHSGMCGANGDNLTWTLNEEGTLTISGKGEMDNYHYPLLFSQYEILTVIIEQGVTSIGDSAFSRCDSLTSITIPKSVKHIGAGSFFYCKSLTNISIPESVTSIGSDAFSGCSSLDNITIPSGVTSINSSLFMGCSGLTRINILGRVTSIGHSAFEECSSLVSLTIPDSVSSIENRAFQGCTSLLSITIPESITSIGSGAFSGCSSLDNITIPSGVTSINSSLFMYCSGLTRIKILGKVTNIGPYAFWHCSSLLSIAIPEGVTSIGYEVFDGCSSLKSVTIPESITSIEAYAFRDCESLTNIAIPEEVTSIGYYAFGGCTSLKSVTIPKGVTGIVESTFYGCKSLSSITIPEGVKYIGEHAFDGCGSLASIIIPDGITSIGEFAFSDCCSLTSIVIPVGVKSIRRNTFYNCSNLSSITIPDGVVSICNSALYGCSNLSVIIIPESVTIIENSAFEGCISLTSFTIPLGVKSIAGSTFKGCSRLSNITIHSDVKSIDSDAFWGCSSLTSITIPEGVTSIGPSAFAHCSSLTSITIPESCTSIGETVFSDCISLASITIPEGVTVIGYGTFQDCRNLTNINFPRSLGYIYGRAFYHCSNITNIFISENVRFITPSAFEGCNALVISGYAGTTAQEYADSKNIPFNSLSVSINGASVIVDDQIYTGKEIEPEAIVDLNGTPLKKGIDYTVSYNNNKDVGIATLKITGLIKYEGTKIITFNIEKAPQSIVASDITLAYPNSKIITISGNQGELSYKSTDTDVVTVDSTGKVKTLNVGTANIIITAEATDNYKEETKTITVTVVKGMQSIMASNLDLEYPYSGKIIVTGNQGVLSFTSSDQNVATVDSLGVVTAEGVGTALITITARETDRYNEESKTITVNVLKGAQVITAPNIALTYPDSGEITATGNQGELIYTSLDSDIIDVSSNGKVTAKGIGTATITITASETDNYNEATKQIKVTVAKGTQLMEASDLTLIYPNSGIITVFGNKGVISYTSSDTDIAEVDSTGKVTPKGTGKATITITAAETDFYTETIKQITVDVTKGTQSLTASNLTLIYPNSGKVTISGNQGELKFISSNTNIATVDNFGIVETKGVGTAKITIKASETANYNETEKEITVIVTKGTQPILASDLSLTYPNSGKIEVSGNHGELSFSSSDTNIVGVDSAGNIVANGSGTTTITINATETDYYKAATNEITITVVKASQGINASNLSLTYLKNGTITASGNKGKLIFKSSNTDIAAVDSTGNVTTKGAGTAKITITAAETDNYKSATKTITVNVAKAAQSITAKAAASRIAVGKTTTVSITGNKGAKSFKSSDTTIATVDKSTGKVTAKKVGTVKITATSAATANYNAASKTVTIKVVPAATASLKIDNQATGIKLTWKKVTGANGYKVYRGSTLIKTITNESTVTFADTKANTNGTKYTYKVVAKAATGDSTLSKSIAVYRVSRPAVSSVANSAAGKMTVKWGKNAKATGYQIQYSTDKTFKTGNKAVTVAGVSTVSKVFGSLTKSKTYYVRIRTYKTVGSTKYWSTWSAAKSVKIAK